MLKYAKVYLQTTERIDYREIFAELECIIRTASERYVRACSSLESEAAGVYQKKKSFHHCARLLHRDLSFGHVMCDGPFYIIIALLPKSFVKLHLSVFIWEHFQGRSSICTSIIKLVWMKIAFPHVLPVPYEKCEFLVVNLEQKINWLARSYKKRK